MMRTKAGNIKEKYKHILPKVSDSIHELIKDLYEEGLDPEEIIGIIAGQAVISVAAEKMRKEIEKQK